MEITLKALEILKNAKGLGFTGKQIIINKYKLEEAIKELESLQKRTCSNCRFSYRIRNSLFDCDKINKLDLPKDFYCNRWAEK